MFAAVSCRQDLSGGNAMLHRQVLDHHSLTPPVICCPLVLFALCTQDLCGGNVMLAASSSAPHGFTAKVGDFGLVRTAAAAAAADDSGDQMLHPVEQRLASNAYG